MGSPKLSLVIDHHKIKGDRVVQILRGIYSHQVSWLRPDPQKDYLRMIDMNHDSIDLIVVAHSSFLADVLEKHKQYEIPTIVRVDKGTQISLDIFAKVGNLEYRPYIMVGLEQNVEKWQEYIEMANQKAKPFGR